MALPKLTFPENYTAISVLISLYKLMKRIIVTRLKQYTATLGMVLNYQYAFKSDHTAEFQVLRVVELIRSNFNRNEATGAIFMDVARDFDRVA